MTQVECRNNELAAVVAKLRTEGKRPSTITVTEDGYRLTLCYDRPAQGELDALLCNPNAQPSRLEANQRMAAASLERAGDLTAISKR